MNAKITLERITPEDAKDFFSLAHSEKSGPSQISRFLPSYVQDYASTREMVLDFSRQHDEKWLYYYMIKADENAVGFVSAEYSRLYLRGFYITYFIGNKYRGLHYMSTALDELLKKIECTGLPCIFDIDKENTASRFLIKRLVSNPYESYVDMNGKTFMTYLVYP